MTIRMFRLALGLFLVACVEGNAPGPAAQLGRRLMVSENTACALDRTGAVFCWGGNTQFQEFGTPNTVTPTNASPTAVPVPKLASLGAGVATHLCGITAEQVAICWGRGTFGQLGGGDEGQVGNPATIVVGDIQWKELAIQRLSSCGISADDTGYCWGTNQRGEIGVDTVPIGALTTNPRAVMGSLKFKSLVAGWLHACAITTTDVTLCWGDNSSGQLGIGAADTMAHRIPTMIAGGLTFVQLSLSGKSSCGLATDGFAYCWGENATGQLGDGTTTSRAVPTRVAGDIKFSSIVTGSGFAGASQAVPPATGVTGGVSHTCALTASGAAYCWGWNGNGQIGDGSVTDRLEPVAVSGNLTFTSIGLGGSYTCGMNGNAVWCWGSNAFGQLGNGQTLTRPEPVQVGAPFDKP